MAIDLDMYRRQINLFVARHQLAWDLGMAALALLYVGMSFLDDLSTTHAFYDTTLAPVEVGITLLFLAEFALRFFAADSRRAYLKYHWIDLVALLPAIRALRFLRVGRLVYLLQMARFLRLGALVRLLVELERVYGRVRWIAAHNGVHVLLTFAVGVVLLGGSAVWELEHTINAQFTNFGDTIWWAFATMTTVGYGNGPVTLAGRVVAAVIMIVGIGCFGLMTATVTTLFLERTHAPEVTATELKAMLESIQARLERIEAEQGRSDRGKQHAIAALVVSGAQREQDSVTS
ncbi:MAG TPA: ion transporter [Ktedonobacterales bacterium]|nr:ion transporter [Ktedonobacterales bacterium]